MPLGIELWKALADLMLCHFKEKIKKSRPSAQHYPVQALLSRPTGQYLSVGPSMVSVFTPASAIPSAAANTPTPFTRVFAT